LKDNTCIRDIWVAWYKDYKSLNPAGGRNPGNVNVPNIYDNFVSPAISFKFQTETMFIEVHEIIKGVEPYIKSQVQKYIASYNPGKSDTDTQEVRVSFAVELDFWTDALEKKIKLPDWVDSRAPKADLQVSRTQLTQEILNAIPSINWLNMLPTH
jgi:hypothetical protein